MKLNFKDPNALVSTIASLIAVPSAVTTSVNGLGPPYVGTSLNIVAIVSVCYLGYTLIRMNLLPPESKFELTFDPERFYRRNWQLLKNEILLDIRDVKGEEVHCTQNVTGRCTFPCRSFFITISPADKIHNVQIGHGYKLETSETADEIKLYITLPNQVPKGTVIDFKISFVFKNSFTRHKEFYVYRKYYNSDRNRITIFFPPDRRPTGFEASTSVEGHADRLTIPKDIIYSNEDGRPTLKVETTGLAVDQNLQILWEW